jgi:sugar phosphate isomerase/epimerase
LSAANRIVAQSGQPNAGVLVDALHFDRSKSLIGELVRVPADRLHYWQLCDGPAKPPETTEEMMHAARHERMFPGQGGIDLVSLIKAMPVDIPVSIEVPTATLAKSLGAEVRARRALEAARKIIALARP